MHGIFGGSLGILISLIIIGVIFSAIKSKGIVHLALRKFEVNKDPNAENVIVIEGRKTGLMSWILVKLKLGNIYQIIVKKEHISYTGESLSGKEHILVPNQKVSSTACGYEKPIIWFFIGVIVIITGFIMLFNNAAGAGIGLMVLGAVCFILYVYMKSFFIRIETFGSSRFGFAFKRSFIENKSIDIEQIEEAIGIINDLVKK